jgi:hypothetical protein
MKIIAPALTVLLAALLVAFGTIAFAQSDYSSSLGASGPQRSLSADGAASADTVGQPAGRPAGHSDEGGMSLMGLTTIGKNLGIIAAIVAAVTAPVALLRWVRSRMASRAVSAAR